MTAFVEKRKPNFKGNKEEKVKIAVCIKQVPDTTDVKIDPKTIPCPGRCGKHYQPLR